MENCIIFTNKTLDVSRLVTVSIPGIKPGSVEGPGLVKKFSKYCLSKGYQNVLFEVEEILLPSCP